MRIYICILFFILISLKVKAQQVQVTKLDSCLGVETKATIILNNDTLAESSTTTNSDTNTFNFNISTPSTTSAGIYNSSGNLVYTLWSGVKYSRGKYSAKWDELMDNGTQAPPGVYTAKVLSNNVQYKWDGVVGNSSDSFTGYNIYTGFSGPNALAFSNGKGYYGDRFAEGDPTAVSFSFSDIGKRLNVAGGLSIVNTAMATDGTNIYYAGYDDYHQGRLNLIYATKISDGSIVDFSAGQTQTVGRSNTSAKVIGVYIGGNSCNNCPTDYDRSSGNYSGLTVNTNYIFASIATLNTLYVINKTTGSTVQTVTLAKPGSLACNTDGTKIWVALQSGIKLYSINSDGTLTGTGTTIAVSTNVAIAVSPTANEIAVADSATNQVKFYNSLLGTLNSTFGQAGGYTNSPSVTYDKFQFLDKKHFIYHPAIAYQPDGSFWLNDAGNYRLLHFNADRTYKEQLAFVRSSRSTNADPNNPSRVFADVLEYQVDYGKTLDNGANGSWKLKNNWNVSDQLDAYAQFEQVATLSNGHTYAIGSNKLFDLTSAGTVLLGSFDGNMILEADGSLYERQWDNTHGATIMKHPLTSFDGNNKPQWGNATTVVSTPDVGNDNPAYYVNNTRGANSNNNYYFFFQPNHDLNFINSVLGNTYHLGGIKTGQNTYNWLASNSTFSKYSSAYDYTGDYPRNGDFDIGNNDYGNGQHSENCKLLVNGPNLFWHVNAEFWQTNSGATNGVNIWNHFNEDGLFIGNFGVTSLEAKTYFENAMAAGNSFSTALAKVGNDYYIYHCDESQHGGVHRWHISGLNTILEQTSSITVSSTAQALNNQSDLMAGIPYRSSNFNGGNGWTFSPATSAGGNFSAPTSILTYKKYAVDIRLTNTGNSDAVAYRDLGTNSTNNWTISGKFAFPQYLSNAENNNMYIQLLDGNDKILVNFTIKDVGSYFDKVQFNDKVLFSGYNYMGAGQVIKQLQPFTIKNLAGRISVSYMGNTANITGPYQTGADFSKPTKLKLKMSGGNGVIEVSELSFEK